MVCVGEMNDHDGRVRRNKTRRTSETERAASLSPASSASRSVILAPLGLGLVGAGVCGW